jgi:pimeloyl-ACP methyl ester carboxylesterase
VNERPEEDAPTGFVLVPDGRRLAFCEWGDPLGAPVVYLHGFPGSRYLRHVGTAYADAHLRVITYDRPGYGLSDAAPGRMVADTAADVAALVDHLGLDRFAVVGVSAGGVHAFAVAAAMPDRVTRCVGVKAIAPFAAEGLDFYEGMGLEDAAAMRLLSSGDREAFEADAEETRAWVENGCPGLDVEEPVAAMLKQAFREAFRQGLEGHIDDLSAQFRGHGYELRSVVAPTWLLAATADEVVPPGHGRWLAGRLPNARLTWLDGGHMDSQADDEIRAFVWAADGTGAGSRRRKG